MRLRPGLSVLATLAFLLTVAVIMPAPAFGFTGPLLAGRPIRDDGQEMQCQGLAYARVGGVIVLLTADHCRKYSDTPGGTAYYHNLNQGVRTNGDVVIGAWGPGKNDGGASWANNDLTFIILFNPYIPAAGLNQVYRGDVTGNGYTGDDNWNITTNPGPADGCAGFPAGGAFPDTSYHNFQATKTSTTKYRSGHVIAFVDAQGGQWSYDPNLPNDTCNLQTDFSVHSTGVDSGSPFIRYSDQTTVNGIATGQWGGKLFFNPLYEGLNDMNTYYVAQNGTGAWLCQTSTC